MIYLYICRFINEENWLSINFLQNWAKRRKLFARSGGTTTHKHISTTTITIELSQVFIILFNKNDTSSINFIDHDKIAYKKIERAKNLSSHLNLNKTKQKKRKKKELCTWSILAAMHDFIDLISFDSHHLLMSIQFILINSLLERFFFSSLLLEENSFVARIINDCGNISWGCVYLWLFFPDHSNKKWWKKLQCYQFYIFHNNEACFLIQWAVFAICCILSLHWLVAVSTHTRCHYKCF